MYDVMNSSILVFFFFYIPLDLALRLDPVPLGTTGIVLLENSFFHLLSQ